MISWVLEQLWSLVGIVLSSILNYVKQRPGAAIIAGVALIRMFGTTVQSGTAGVLFSWGRAKKVLEPGFHPLIPIVQSVRHTPIRSVTLDLPRQRVTTSDGLVYDIDTTIVYRVDDPIQAAVAIDDVRQGVTTLMPLLVHDLLREQTRVSLGARELLDQELTQRARDLLRRWGLAVETAGISTIAPTRPTVRLSQLGARVAERLHLYRSVRAQGVAPTVAAALTSAVAPPQAKPRARYRRHHDAAATDHATSRISVIMPAGARLTVNGVEMLASDARTFETPRLERGATYFYSMHILYFVHGLPLEETRVVRVQAGQLLVVDFTQPAPEPESLPESD